MGCVMGATKGITKGITKSDYDNSQAGSGAQR